MRSKLFFLRASIILVLIIGICSELHAQTTKDITPTSRVITRFNNNGSVSYSQGISASIGTTGASPAFNSYRTQLIFPVSQIPSNAIISSVKLTYAITNDPSADNYKSRIVGLTGQISFDVNGWNSFTNSTTVYFSDLLYGTDYTGNNALTSTDLTTNVSSAISSGGSFSIGVMSQNEDLTNSLGGAMIALLTVVYTQPGPPQPTLISPTNGATNVSRTPTLSWNASSGATSYTVNGSWGSATVTGTSYTTPTLAAGTTYTWSVTASNVGGSSPASSTWSFTTMSAPPPPILTVPANGATNVTRSATLCWNASSGATSYTVHGYWGNTSVTGTSFTTPTLAANTLYQWSVTAVNTVGSATSAIWSYTTVPAPPPAPILISPVNGVIASPPSMAFHWNASPGATLYIVAGSWGSDFTEGTSYVTYNLVANRTYTWYVTASNVGGSSPPSSTWQFNTYYEPPAAPILSSPANGATNVQRTATLSWNASSGAVSYTVHGYWGNTSVTGTSFTTPTLAANTLYQWSVTAVNPMAGTTSATWSYTTGSLAKRSAQQNMTGSMNPTEYALEQNYPNPFNPTTTIKFALTKNAMVMLKVYDLLGREVQTLVNEDAEAGYYTVPFDASRLVSSVYFIRLFVQAQDGGKPFVQVRKMLLMK